MFDTAFGGKEVVVIMERDRDAKPELYESKLRATSKTSTVNKLIDGAAPGTCELALLMFDDIELQ